MIEWKTLQIYLAIFAIISVVGQYMGMVTTEVTFIYILLVAVLFFYYEFVVYRKYPVLVPIWIKRSGRAAFLLDRASRKKDENGVEYYQLRSSKKKTKPPKFDHVIETVKGYILPLYSPSADEYREIDIEDGKIKIMEEDMKAWYKYWIKKHYSDWAPELSIWVRYQPIIYMSVLGAIVMIWLYLMTGMTEQWGATINQATAQITGALNNLGGLVKPPTH